MFQFYLIIIFSFLVGYYFVDRRRKYESYWKHVYALPGPDYYPIAGNLDGIGNEPDEIFQIVCDRLKQYTPICRFWTFGHAEVYLLDPPDIEIVLSSMKHMTKGVFYNYLHQWLGTGLLTSTGAKWQKRRKILTPAFHFSILQDFVKIFNRETDTLVENLKKVCDKDGLDVVEPITEFTLNSIGETSLGVNMNLQPKRMDYKNAIYTFANGLVYVVMRPWLKIPFVYKFSPVAREIHESVRLLHKFSNGIIGERKKSFEEIRNLTEKKKKMALIDLLLKASISGNADIDEAGIREEIDTFMFEGHDTTTVGISYLLLAIANEPKWQDEIRKEIFEILGDSDVHPTYQQLGEMKLMERCIKEGLRLYPSVPNITRVAEEGFTTSSGHYVPKGIDVNVNIFGLHRSERIWENPKKFDPDRFLPENAAKRHPFSFIPFSAGPRNCIGQKFAILEMKSALCGILKNFNLEPVDKPEDIVFKIDMVLRPKGEIRVKFVPRANSC